MSLPVTNVCSQTTERRTPRRAASPHARGAVSVRLRCGLRRSPSHACADRAAADGLVSGSDVDSAVKAISRQVTVEEQSAIGEPLVRSERLERVEGNRQGWARLLRHGVVELSLQGDRSLRSFRVPNLRSSAARPASTLAQATPSFRHPPSGHPRRRTAPTETLTPPYFGIGSSARAAVRIAFCLREAVRLASRGTSSMKNSSPSIWAMPVREPGMSTEPSGRS